MCFTYKHSHFESDIFGHGGNKRTAQINQLLIEAGIEFKEIDFSNYSPSSKNIPSFFKGVLKNHNNKLDIKKNYVIGRYNKQFESFVSNCKPRFVIWESVVQYNLLLAKVLHQKNVPFIAVPHNLESLIKGTTSVFSGKIVPNWLDEELDALRYAIKVFTMSREEAWLLSLYGIEASYLPYYTYRL